jgi:hypothetical protein
VGLNLGKPRPLKKNPAAPATALAAAKCGGKTAKNRLGSHKGLYEASGHANPHWGGLRLVEADIDSSRLITFEVHSSVRANEGFRGFDAQAAGGSGCTYSTVLVR